ncbi:hypothetical protein NMG60_11006558 [Bertholletia excelsa]
MRTGRYRWKISFHWSHSATKKQPPKEFICPLLGSLMADPVIVSSGQTFQRNCVEACKSLGFEPTISDGSTPEFSTGIANLALKSAILNWCNTYLVDHPKPIDSISAERCTRTLMASQKQQVGDAQTKTQLKLTHAETELTRRPGHFSSNSDESFAGATCGSTTPLPLNTRPSCYSSSFSSDIEALNPNSTEDDDFITKLKSSQVFEQEDALVSLRKITRRREDARVQLGTPPLLSALRSLITSRYATVQANAIAALANLSLENQNKVKIVGSGIVPPLIDVLKGGFAEAQDHAAGALFSLALDDDQNKTAIGVLGALPPLLHALRSDSDRARYDSALALYHLSHSFRATVLMGMVRTGQMTGRVLSALCNMAVCADGRAGFDSESTRESCVAALYGLSLGGLRFKGLTREAGAEEVLREVEQGGSVRAKEKAKPILETLKAKDEEEEVVDLEELLNSREVSRTF